MSDSGPIVPGRQLRLALVFNGGVSLAVWMGGVAKEIDRFRCAGHRAQQTMDADPSLAYYERLLRILRTDVVTDVMAGTSAGGINAAFLGYVAGNGKSLEVGGANAIRDAWRALGKIAKLLIFDGKATSALSGDVLFCGCAGVFKMLSAREADLNLDAPTGVSLTITATDSRGFAVPAVDNNTAVDHRLEMRFCAADRAAVSGPPLPAAVRDASAALPPLPSQARPMRNLTELATAPALLARATRATASFPLAFAPVELSLDEDKARLEEDPTSLTGTPRMREVIDTRSRDVTLDGPDRLAIDGGVWDNAPFDTVLSDIDAMGAAGDVDRRLVYIVAADPPASKPADEPAPDATPLAAVGDAQGVCRLVEPVVRALTSPSNVAFIDDLERIQRDLAQQRSRRSSLAALLASGQPDVFLLAGQLFDQYRIRVRDDGDAVVPPPDLTLDPAAPSGDWGETEADWKWGARPVRTALESARRVLRDVLRELEPIPGSAAARTELTDARAQLSALSEVLRRAVADGSQTEPYGEIMHAFADIAAAGRNSVQAALPSTPLAASVSTHPACDLLLSLTDGGHETIVRRALALEVAIHALSGDHRRTKVDYQFTTIRPDRPSALESPTASSSRPPLSGIAYDHFGGFLRDSWRLSDWMWGRLDGCTHLIEVLLDPAQVQRLTGGDSVRRAELAGSLAELARPGQPEVARDYEAALESGSLETIQRDLLRPLHLAIVEQEAKSVLAALVEEQDQAAVAKFALPSPAELDQSQDKGLELLGRAMQTKVPAVELTGVGEEATGNLATAAGQTVAGAALRLLSRWKLERELIDRLLKDAEVAAQGAKESEAWWKRLKARAMGLLRPRR